MNFNTGTGPKLLANYCVIPQKQLRMLDK